MPIKMLLRIHHNEIHCCYYPREIWNSFDRKVRDEVLRLEQATVLKSDAND